MKYLLTILTTYITMYLLMSFVFWGMNPENWSEFARAFYVVVSGAISFPAMGLIHEIRK